MKTTPLDNILMRIIAAALLVSSAAILLVPVAGNYAAVTMITAGLFWGGMIVGYALFFRLARRLKAHKAKGRKGILSFMKNLPAACFDAGGLLCFIALILLSVFPVWGTYIYYVLLFFLLFCFHMHCILNGRTYKLLRDGTSSPNKAQDAQTDAARRGTGEKQDAPSGKTEDGAPKVESDEADSSGNSIEGAQDTEPDGVGNAQPYETDDTKNNVEETRRNWNVMGRIVK